MFEDCLVSSKVDDTPEWVVTCNSTFIKMNVENIVGVVFHADKVFLEDMFSQKKTAKSGKEYTSNKCVLSLYNMEEQERIVCYIENFGRYRPFKDGHRLTLRRRDENPLFNIFDYYQEFKQLQSEYIVDWEAFRKNVNQLTNLNFEAYDCSKKQQFTDVTVKIVEKEHEFED